jgi:hypothetical protein
MLHLPYDVRLILCFDLDAAIYIGLFVTLMNVTTLEQVADLASRIEPSGVRTLIFVVLMSTISVVSVGALQATGHDPEWVM